MIKIVHYSPEMEELHREFALKYWQKRKRTTPEYIYWKFRGKEGQQLDSFILAVEENKVVGQLGLIPCSVMVKDENVEAQWVCDLMVDTDYRGSGVAKLLYEYAYTLKPLTLGSDPSPAAAISMKRAGFTSLDGPVKFFFPVFLGEIARLKGFNSNLLDKIPNPFLLPLKIWKYFGRGEKFQKKLNGEHKTFNNGQPQGNNDLRVVHDESFMNWKLTPYKDYYQGLDFFQNDSDSGFSLYRGKETYLVTDYSAVRLSNLLDILGRIVCEANANKSRNLKLMANSKREFYTLLLLGFVPFRTKTQIIFYTSDETLKKKMTGKYFRYTYLDSDENI